MFIPFFTIMALLMFPSVKVMAAGDYSYDMNDPLGPNNWAMVDVEDNQCGGSAQTPINIESTPCTEVAEYTLNVRCSSLKNKLDDADAWKSAVT
jgi:carbonic anhydrase